MNLDIKSLELTAKVEEAGYHLEFTQQALTQAHINDGDTQRCTADVQAAQITLDALESALEGIQQKIAEEADEALQAQKAKAASIQVRKSQKYQKTIQMADEHLSLFVKTLDDADQILADLSANGSVDLKAAIRGAASPLAVATAAKLGETNQQFIEKLALALQRYKVASQQCRGRSMAEMAIDPSSL
jgi:hypothetical protein